MPIYTNSSNSFTPSQSALPNGLKWVIFISHKPVKSNKVSLKCGNTFNMPASGFSGRAKRSQKRRSLAMSTPCAALVCRCDLDVAPPHSKRSPSAANGSFPVVFRRCLAHRLLMFSMILSMVLCLLPVMVFRFHWSSSGSTGMTHGIANLGRFVASHVL